MYAWSDYVREIPPARLFFESDVASYSLAKGVGLVCGMGTAPKFNTHRSNGKKMAGDSRFEKVREELICAICLDFLREPKVLQCAHSFCQQCLERMVATQGYYKIAGESLAEGDLACPSCRHVTSLPGRGKVSQLRTNFNLKRLVDIVSEDEKARTRMTIRRRRSSRPIIDRKSQPNCPVHQKPLEYFCADCNELLCRKCMIAGHRDHSYKDVDEVLPEQLAALQNLIQPACEVNKIGDSESEAGIG